MGEVVRERKIRIPTQSGGETAMALVLRSLGIRFLEQQRFAQEAIGRLWLADFLLPDLNTIVEVDGGTWTGGRHVRGEGFARDCEKTNAAAILGWTVLRFTTEMVEDGTARETLEWLAASRAGVGG